MKKLDPKAVWLFFLQSSIGSIVFIFFITACFGFTFLMDSSPSSVGSFFVFYFLVLLCISVFIIAFCFLFAKLSYSNYKYELKEDGFYKESGVITKKYVTIPYERIQNVDINRSLLSRFFGLSDLQIQTAGNSTVMYGRYGAYGMNAEGRLPAVSKEEAVVIRDELIKRARGVKAHSGL